MAVLAGRDAHVSASGLGAGMAIGAGIAPRSFALGIGLAMLLPALIRRPAQS